MSKKSKHDDARVLDAVLEFTLDDTVTSGDALQVLLAAGEDPVALGGKVRDRVMATVWSGLARDRGSEEAIAALAASPTRTELARQAGELLPESDVDLLDALTHSELAELLSRLSDRGKGD